MGQRQDGKMERWKDEDQSKISKLDRDSLLVVAWSPLSHRSLVNLDGLVGKVQGAGAWGEMEKGASLHVSRSLE